MKQGRVTCHGNRWSPAPICEHETLSNEDSCFAGPSSPVSSDIPLSDVISSEMVACPSSIFTCSGYINHWEIGALPATSGNIVAFVSVWRPTDIKGAFRMVGANKVQPRPGIHLYDVQPSEQILAEAGDIIGIYYADNTVNGIVPYRHDPTGKSHCLTAPVTSSEIMTELSNRGFVYLDSGLVHRQYIIRAHIDNGKSISLLFLHFFNEKKMKKLKFRQCYLVAVVCLHWCPMLVGDQ